MPIEQIARLIGHAGGPKVTESVYRKQLRPQNAKKAWSESPSGV
ncbi:MAG: hypothetical protein NTW05_28005 [Pseudonocardiales bacterium]|nr:hypothetical protein [Pseudonocardiales bacterium]